MRKKQSEQTVGKDEPEFRIDIFTLIFIIIGGISSWINMLIIYESMTIPSYLSIIFTTLIPGIIIGVKNRYWGYGYMIGFSGAGIPFIYIDVFIGGYTFATAIFLFIIVLLIFWKAWRSLSSIKTVSQ